VPVSSLHSPEESKAEPAAKEDDTRLFSIFSEEGISSIEGIDFKLDEKFKSGSYIIICRDVTKALEKKFRMEEIRVLLKIVDLDEEHRKLEEAEADKHNKNKAPQGKKK